MYFFNKNLSIAYTLDHIFHYSCRDIGKSIPYSVQKMWNIVPPEFKHINTMNGVKTSSFVGLAKKVLMKFLRALKIFHMTVQDFFFVLWLWKYQFCSVILNQKAFTQWLAKDNCPRGMIVLFCFNYNVFYRSFRPQNFNISWQQNLGSVQNRFREPILKNGSARKRCVY